MYQHVDPVLRFDHSGSMLQITCARQCRLITSGPGSAELLNGSPGGFGRLKAILMTSEPTIVDVAERCGVSKSTVSLVFRGSDLVAEETRKRVLAAANELGYVPNQTARNFRSKRSGMIGVVISNLGLDWADSIMKGMLRAFEGTRFTPFMAVHYLDVKRAERELLACLERRDEGIICQPILGLETVYQQLHDSHVPFVFIGDYPIGMSDSNIVAWDSTRAAHLAIEHLIASGRRRIAYVSIEYPMVLNQSRLGAYNIAIEKAGLDLPDHYRVIGELGVPVEQIAADAITMLFNAPDPPDAIMAVNDAMALELLHVLEARGLRVPRDVALMGLGDYPLSRNPRINLSSVAEPTEEIGFEAASLLKTLIAKPIGLAQQRFLEGTDVKIRGTTSAADGN